MLMLKVKMFMSTKLPLIPIQIYFDETKYFLLGFLAYHEKALNQLGKDNLNL